MWVVGFMCREGVKSKQTLHQQLPLTEPGNIQARTAVTVQQQQLQRRRHNGYYFHGDCSQTKTHILTFSSHSRHYHEYNSFKEVDGFHHWPQKGLV